MDGRVLRTPPPRRPSTARLQHEVTQAAPSAGAEAGSRGTAPKRDAERSLLRLGRPEGTGSACWARGTRRRPPPGHVAVNQLAAPPGRNGRLQLDRLFGPAAHGTLPVSVGSPTINASVNGVLVPRREPPIVLGHVQQAASWTTRSTCGSHWAGICPMKARPAGVAPFALGPPAAPALRGAMTWRPSATGTSSVLVLAGSRRTNRTGCNKTGSSRGMRD